MRPRPLLVSGFGLFDHDTGTRAQTQERRLSPSLRLSRFSIIVIQLVAVPSRSQIGRAQGGRNSNDIYLGEGLHAAQDRHRERRTHPRH
jgi:hypothetical protein